MESFENETPLDISEELMFSKLLTRWLQLEYQADWLEGQAWPQEMKINTHDLGEIAFMRSMPVLASSLRERLEIKLGPITLYVDLGYDRPSGGSRQYVILLHDWEHNRDWARTITLEGILYDGEFLSDFIKPQSGPWWAFLRRWMSFVPERLDVHQKHLEKLTLTWKDYELKNISPRNDETKGQHHMRLEKLRERLRAELQSLS